jgi:hypothetical protein
MATNWPNIRTGLIDYCDFFFCPNTQILTFYVQRLPPSRTSLFFILHYLQSCLKEKVRNGEHCHFKHKQGVKQSCELCWQNGRLWESQEIDTLWIFYSLKKVHYIYITCAQVWRGACLHILFVQFRDQVYTTVHSTYVCPNELRQVKLQKRRHL